MISRAVGRQSVLSQPPDEFTAHTGLKLESAYIDFAVDDSRPAVKVRQALDNRGIFAGIDARGIALQSLTRKSPPFPGDRPIPDLPGPTHSRPSELTDPFRLTRLESGSAQAVLHCPSLFFRPAGYDVSAINELAFEQKS